ncbi:DoxX family protein [Bacillus sp. RG28]|uniref:DoxX family protein n=1 Tax=Gottfriedia endophytica TaxID=2820819 RepID=A0A940NQ62_9BACI|nr:DoxX family protein [Gottfriedia endophytica]MBP0725730.1 DoxX family protein [Gottfriedia endophytica]
MIKKYEIGALVLRLVLGITFFIHGFAKFQGGIENVAGWFSSMGLPGFMAYAIATIELVGGIALILGLGTRVISTLFVFVMLGAIIKVKLAAGFMGDGKTAGYELELVLLAIAVYLVVCGSRLFSLQNLFGNKEK